MHMRAIAAERVSAGALIPTHHSTARLFVPLRVPVQLASATGKCIRSWLEVRIGFFDG